MADEEPDSGDGAQSPEAEGGTRKNISIHLRVRPTNESSQAVSVEADTHSVQISVPRTADQGYAFYGLLL